MRAPQVPARLIELTLVGEDLADVGVGERDVGCVARPLAAFAGLLVEVHRLLPAPAPVGEPAEVVEHARLVLRIAQLAIDLQGAL
jgi:hypothetical protein